MSFNKDFIEACVAGTAVREGCVLSRYETVPKEIMAMKSHLERYGQEEWIPIYWEVDVADENNGWFPGFALHFSENPLRLHIAVSNERGTAYDGEVQLDWRVIRLRRCIQENTAALFKKIVRDSVLCIRWEVDFLDTRDSMPITLTEDNCIGIASPKVHLDKGKWEQSVARYYITMLNLLLIDDQSKSPVTYISDNDHIILSVHRQNLRLRYCHKLKGLAIFESLVFEEGIRCAPQGREQIKEAALTCRYPYEHTKKPRGPIRRKSPPKPQESTCVVCLSSPISSVAFVPCGHQVMCLSCLQDSAKRKDLLCPLCRQVIKQRITIYKP